MSTAKEMADKLNKEAATVYKALPENTLSIGEFLTDRGQPGRVFTAFVEMGAYMSVERSEDPSVVAQRLRGGLIISANRVIDALDKYIKEVGR